MPEAANPSAPTPASTEELKHRPEPDDPRKPSAPTDLKSSDWRFTLKSTMREFGEDGLTDSAAALTYFSVLSLFPAVIALVSILSLFGQGGDRITNLINEMVAQGVLPASATESLLPALSSVIQQTPAPGIGLAVGILAAAWSASNYVKGFGRALNTIYEVKEGRSVIRLNLEQYALTLAILLLLALVLVLTVVSGPIARTIGELVGLGDQFAQIFDLAKIPFILIALIVIVALLYNFTPNVRQPKVRWISIGAVVALIVAALASALLGVYLTFMGNSSYAKTYGALAGVIIFLFWLWIMNTALLFGAELDAELERSRQLRAGIAAEEQIQLPAKSLVAAEKAEEKARADIDQGRQIRLQAAAENGEGAEQGAEASRPGATRSEEAADSDARPRPTYAGNAATDPDRVDAAKAAAEARDAKSRVKAARDARPPIDHYRKQD